MDMDGTHLDRTPPESQSGDKVTAESKGQVMQMKDVATVVAAFQQRRPTDLCCFIRYLTAAAFSVEC